MITKELIERINSLARKQNECGLTEEERAEQQQLRRVYIDCIKGRVKETLDRVKIVEDQPQGACGCGCNHKH